MKTIQQISHLQSMWIYLKKENLNYLHSLLYTKESHTKSYHVNILLLELAIEVRTVRIFMKLVQKQNYANTFLKTPVSKVQNEISPTILDDSLENTCLALGIVSQETNVGFPM